LDGLEMAVIENHSDGDESLDGGIGDDSVDDRVTEGIGSLEIVTGVTALGEESGEDEDEEEEYEDVAWGGGGLKGFVQKPEEPWKIMRQYFPSKVGGAPAWLDPLNLPNGEHMLCGICDKPLQFVLQVIISASLKLR
jgi:hypothetical protein